MHSADFFINGTVGKVFNPGDNNGENGTVETECSAPFSSHFPHLCFFFLRIPPLFSHCGSCSDIFHPDFFMIPYFPPFSPIPPHFPISFSISPNSSQIPPFSSSCRTPKTWFGELGGGERGCLALTFCYTLWNPFSSLTGPLTCPVDTLRSSVTLSLWCALMPAVEASPRRTLNSR